MSEVEQKFKIGDKVEVVEASELDELFVGEEYTVEAYYSSLVHLSNRDGMGNGFFEQRFELVKEEWKDGIPQAGTICEAQVKNGGNWNKYTIKFVGDEYMVIEDPISETPIKYVYWEFRPIKTAEEIAAEEAAKEREKNIDDLCKLLDTDRSSYMRLVAERLYDAGWRKV